MYLRYDQFLDILVSPRFCRQVFIAFKFKNNIQRITNLTASRDLLLSYKRRLNNSSLLYFKFAYIFVHRQIEYITMVQAYSLMITKLAILQLITIVGFIYLSKQRCPLGINDLLI